MSRLIAFQKRRKKMGIQAAEHRELRAVTQKFIDGNIDKVEMQMAVKGIIKKYDVLQNKNNYLKNISTGILWCVLIVLVGAILTWVRK